MTGLHIIFEDQDLIVVDKPTGLLTSTVPREPRPTLLVQVRSHLAATDPKARAGLIHRLDRDASGLLVFSKNDDAYQSLKRQFFNHSVDRVYAALIEGIPGEPKGVIRSKLIELPTGQVVKTTSPKGRIAVTEYVLLKTVETSDGPRSLLRVTLQTGRKHQIRAHLADRGTPIVNDPLYGNSKPTGRLMLAAILLAVRHPRTNKRMKWELDMPPEMRAILREKVQSPLSSRGRKP